MYIVIAVIVIGIVFAYWLLKNEIFDTMCPLGCDKFGKQCYEGNSKYYAAGKHTKEDTIDMTLNKMEYLNRYSDRIVTWRRAFIVSLISSLIVTSLLGAFEMKSFVLVFLVIFMSINGMFSFYKYHLELYPQGYLQENINVLRKKLNKTEPRVFDNIHETIDYLSGKRS